MLELKREIAVFILQLLFIFEDDKLELIGGVADNY